MDQTARNRETGRSVAWALQSYLEKLIPNELIGGRENKKQLIKNIKKTFLFGKDDSVSQSHLIDKIRVERIVYIRQMTATRFDIGFFYSVFIILLLFYIFLHLSIVIN